jgi:hypothetical protein
VTPDPDVESEFREIRGILRETVQAISANSDHIANLTSKFDSMVSMNTGLRDTAVAQLKQFTGEAVARATGKLTWFLVAAVVLSALGERGLAIIAKLVGIP